MSEKPGNPNVSMSPELVDSFSEYAYMEATKSFYKKDDKEMVATAVLTTLIELHEALTSVGEKRFRFIRGQEVLDDRLSGEGIVGLYSRHDQHRASPEIMVRIGTKSKDFAMPLYTAYVLHDLLVEKEPRASFPPTLLLLGKKAIAAYETREQQ